jgi:endonuclease/exonuclease/phosphatase family metal-dependent hydrolase
MSVELTAMTFNIRTDRGMDGLNTWWLRRKATVDTILGVAPDVAALQEVRRLQLGYLIAELSDYEVLSQGRANGRNRGEHCPVLFRRDRFVVDQWGVRWFSNNQRGRIATIVQLRERDGGAPLGVVSTHFDHRSAATRGRSAAALAIWLRATPGPWVVMGDMNATVVEASMQTMLSTGFRDALGHLAPRGPDLATSHHFTGRTDGSRIDHILISGGLEVIDATIVRERPRGRLPSDHWPVAARLRRTGT